MRRDKRPCGPPIERVLVQRGLYGTVDTGDAEFCIQLPKRVSEPTQIRSFARGCDVDIPGGVWGPAKLGCQPADYDELDALPRREPGVK